MLFISYYDERRIEMEIEEIYKLFFKDVYRYLYSIVKNQSVAEDMTQDTFIKVMKNIEKFDGSKNIKAWLFTIARNTLYTYYNREKMYSYQECEKEIVSNASKDVLTEYIEKEAVEKIECLIDELREPYKAVFCLRHYGGLSFEEIASVFEKNAGWARVVFYRAKNQVLKEMEKNI